jgi:hypothetical protein
VRSYPSILRYRNPVRAKPHAPSGTPGGRLEILRIRVQGGQVVAAGEKGRVVGCDAPLEDRDGASMQSGGLRRPPALREQDAEVGQRRCEVGVVDAEQALELRVPAPVEGFGFVDPAAPEQVRGQLAARTPLTAPPRSLR